MGRAAPLHLRLPRALFNLTLLNLLDSHVPTLQACPLDGVSPFCCVSCTTHIGECTLNPIVYVIEKDVEERQSQDGLLRETIHAWLPPGHRAIDHNPLAMIIQPTFYPPTLQICIFLI